MKLCTSLSNDLSPIFQRKLVRMLVFILIAIAAAFFMKYLSFRCAKCVNSDNFLFYPRVLTIKFKLKLNNSYKKLYEIRTSQI